MRAQRCSVKASFLLPLLFSEGIDNKQSLRHLNVPGEGMEPYLVDASSHQHTMVNVLYK